MCPDERAWWYWRCVQCGWPQTVDQVETTRLQDLPTRTYIWGAHDPCGRCGNESRPLWWERCVYEPSVAVSVPPPTPLGWVASGAAWVVVHAGPPADQPKQPTPAQILWAVGITPPEPWLDD